MAIDGHPRVPRCDINVDSATAECINDEEEGHVRVHHQDSHVMCSDEVIDLVEEALSFLFEAFRVFGHDVVDVKYHHHEVPL